MLQNYSVEITDFIKFTNSGVIIADFVQVRDALINKYKDVYGSDIDLSTGNADGVFVNDLALIINNILQSYKTLYANLNVNTASGIYLDNLCALANITRKPATNSVASLSVTNTAASQYEEENPIFVDSNGTEWVYQGTLTLSASGSAGSSGNIDVICKDSGPVKAVAGSINKTLVADSYLTVVQSTDAIVGEEIESDADLRARRSQSTGADGVSVLDSLVGALLELSGIRDVKIYNNNTDSDTTAKDTTTVTKHSEYILIRQDAGASVNTDTIGNIIYEKMTPGILTSPPKSSFPASEKFTYTYTPKFKGQQITQFNTSVYWRKPTPINPAITITMTAYDNFSENEFETIKSNLCQYLNNLPLSTDINSNGILIEASYADPHFLGNPTYLVTNVTITSGESQVTSFTNPDTYFNYSNLSFTKVGNVYTVTLS